MAATNRTPTSPLHLGDVNAALYTVHDQLRHAMVKMTTDFFFLPGP